MAKSRNFRVLKARKQSVLGDSRKWCEEALEVVGFWQRPLGYSAPAMTTSLKRAMPSDFSYSVDQPPCKRSCKRLSRVVPLKRAMPLGFDYDVDRRPSKRVCYEMPTTPFTRTPTKMERFFTELAAIPRSTSSHSASSSFNDSDEDDIFSVCSTETNCTAHSWDFEYSTSANATTLQITDAQKEEVAQEPSKVNHKFSEGMERMQERAQKIDLSLSQFDRSFGVPECKPVASEDIELQDPTEQYASFQSVEVQKLLAGLKSLHLDQNIRTGLSPQPTIAATPSPLPQPQYNTVQDFSQREQPKPAAISKSPASENTKDLAAPLIASPPTVRKPSCAESAPPSPPTSSSMKRGRQISELESFEQNEERPKKMLCQPNAYHNDPFSTIRENLYLVASDHHMLVEKMLLQCEGHSLETRRFPREGDRPKFENRADALMDQDSYGFNFIGQGFYFRELHPGTVKNWYTALYNRAIKDDKTNFRDILRTMFMSGLHPKDCFPRNSKWLDYFFKDEEVYLNNAQIDDIYAWRVLGCTNGEKPEFFEPPYGEDVELVEAFSMGGSLDILQKVVVDWLDIDDGRLSGQRARDFRIAMEDAHLCDSKENQEEDALFKWLETCEMGFADTCNDPERAKAREALEEALLKLITYRYPRSWFLGSNEPLPQARNDNPDNEVDECDNRVPGRG